MIGRGATFSQLAILTFSIGITMGFVYFVEQTSAHSPFLGVNQEAG